MESTYQKDDDGCELWQDENGLYHRADGPCYIDPTGYYHWAQRGKYHRLDGPARSWIGEAQEMNTGAYSKSNIPLDPEQWFVNGNPIARPILEEWMTECDVNPNWKEWTDEEKVMFRLRFS